MDNEISASALMKLLGIRKSTLGGTCREGVIVKGKRDSYLMLPPVPQYYRHLREEAAARGVDARASGGANGACR